MTCECVAKERIIFYDTIGIRTLIEFVNTIYIHSDVRSTRLLGFTASFECEQSDVLKCIDYYFMLRIYECAVLTGFFYVSAEFVIR